MSKSSTTSTETQTPKSTVKRTLSQSVLLLVFLWIVFVVTGIGTSGDSRWTVPQALSVLYEGNLDLDEYPKLLEASNYTAIETIDAHSYSIFPIGTVLLATPFVGAMELGVKSLCMIAPGLCAQLQTNTPADAGQSLLITYYWRVEQAIAAFFVALTAVILFHTFRFNIRRTEALVLALAFALCTSAWSIGSTALWQHGPSMLMLALTLLLLQAARVRPTLAAYAALPLAFAYVVRPTNSLSIVALTAYVAFYHRDQIVRYFLIAFAVALPFIAYNLLIYGMILPPYYLAARLGLHGDVAEALAANILSPARGLLVYSPVFLFCPLGVFLWHKRRERPPLHWFLVGIITVHWVVVSLFPHWWGGTTYGPRFFSDLAPYFTFLLVPVIPFFRTRKSVGKQSIACAFGVALVLSAFMHYQGAASLEAWHWNLTPIHIDTKPDRIWDWRDPPFLRRFRPQKDTTPAP